MEEMSVDEELDLTATEGMASSVGMVDVVGGETDNDNMFIVR